MRWAVVTMLLLGCGGAQSGVSPLQRPSPMPAASVAAGSEVHATMTDRIASDTSKPGDAFVLHVDDTMTAVDGRTLITKGSVLRGHVVRVTRDPPRIDLAFDTIETRDGPVSIHAMLVDVGSHGQVLTLRLGDPSDGGIAPSRTAIGGGPPPEDVRGARVEVPEGARIRLLLLDPIVPLDRR